MIKSLTVYSRCWIHNENFLIQHLQLLYMDFKTLSIIIPAYNEENTIHFILDKVKAVKLDGGLQKQLIIVNDCSSDDTKGAVDKYMAANTELDITYYEHEVNKGKGAALHTGINNLTGGIVIIQDADLEYNPKEYPALLEPIIEGKADVV